MTPLQKKILLVFVLGTGAFAAAAQGLVSQSTGLFLLLGLMAVIRFGLISFS